MALRSIHVSTGRAHTATAHAILGPPEQSLLTEMNLRATLREKLGATMEPSVILGACNPPLAHCALDADRDIGLLLPYNVVVRAAGAGNRADVADVADSQAMLGIVGNSALDEVAVEVKRRLERVVAALAGIGTL